MFSSGNLRNLPTLSLPSPSPYALLRDCVLNSLADSLISKCPSSCVFLLVASSAYNPASINSTAHIPTPPNTAVLGFIFSYSRKGLFSKLFLFSLSLGCIESLYWPGHCPLHLPLAHSTLKFWLLFQFPMALMAGAPRTDWLSPGKPWGKEVAKGKADCLAHSHSAVPPTVPDLSSLLNRGVLTLPFVKLAPRPSLKCLLGGCWQPPNRYLVMSVVKRGSGAEQVSRPAGRWWFRSAAKISIGLMASSRKKSEWIN